MPSLHNLAETLDTDHVGAGGQVQRFYSILNTPKRYFRVEEDAPRSIAHGDFACLRFHSNYEGVTLFLRSVGFPILTGYVLAGIYSRIAPPKRCTSGSSKN